MSKQSAECPAFLAAAIADVLAPLLSTGPELHSIPRSYESGAGERTK